MLVQVYVREAVSRKVLMNGSNAFTKGRKRLRICHVRVSHRQAEPQTVQQMLAEDRRLTLRLIAEELGISNDTAHTIVREDLGKRKIYSQFVSLKLTDEQKAKRMETSGVFISMCDQDPLLLENNVMGDETWCYQFNPESKWQSVAWCSLTSLRPKRVVCKNSRSKHC